MLTIFLIFVLLLRESIATSEPNPQIFAFEDGSFNSASEEDLANQFLMEVESALPQKMKLAFYSQIPVSFLETPGYEQDLLLSFCNSQDEDKKEGVGENKNFSNNDVHVIYGAAFIDSKKIKIHPGFRPIITLKRIYDIFYNCSHKNLYQMAKATLIHELGHLYDHFAIRTEDEKEMVDEAFNMAYDVRERQDASIKMMDYKRTISSKREFRFLSGWIYQGFIYKSDEQRNHLVTRSPDLYEFTDIEENFATNLEFYLLDPEYKCRKPLYHDFFVRHFGEEPLFQQNCEPTKVVKIQREDMVGYQNEVVLDPSRIYEIDFLFADKGESTMSRWGHAMFRIVTCSKNHAASQDCLLDVSEHLVVSFRANVNDLIIDTWKGLVGGYASLQFILPFTQAQNEYNVLENRNLLSVPLKLNESEKKRFIENVMTNAWAYRGKYKFFSNNCASEALTFLQTVLPYNEALQQLRIFSPVGLYEELKRIGLIDTSVLSNNKIAAGQQTLSTTHLFKSKRENLLNIFKQISDFMPYFDIDQYADESRASERPNYYFTAIKRGLIYEQKFKKAFAAKFYLCEQYIKRRLIINIQNQALRLLESDENNVKKIKKRLTKLLNEEEQRNIYSISIAGYGIPTKEEYERARAQLSKENGLSTALLPLLNDPIFQPIKSSFNELKEIEKNLKLFRKYSVVEYLPQ